MAKINKEILGKVRGTLGDITFRQRNGKSYLATRPGTFMPGQDQASIIRREKFAIDIKLSQAIYSLNELKTIWTREKPKGIVAFNYIFKVNYPMIGTGNVISSIKLVPGLSFNVKNPVINFEPAQISVNFDALGTSTDIDTEVETSVKLLSIVYLDNPIDNSVEKFRFITLSSAVQATVLDQLYSFTLSLSDAEVQLFTMYQNHKGFFIIVTMDADHNIGSYSNTFAS